MAALPYLIMSIMVIVFSHLSDCFVTNGYLTLIQSRKVFNTIGQWGPAVCLLILSQITVVTQTYAILLLCIAMGLNGGTSAGYFINHIDISPNYAGNIIAACQVLSNLLSFLGPTLITYVVYDMV